MKTAFRALCLLIVPVAAACVVGCENGGHFTVFGYTTQPPVDCDIRTVYVPIAKNTTYLRGVEFELTKEVVRALGTSPYRVTSNRNGADTELLMKVVANGKSVVLINQFGENRDAELRINIEVEWHDLRPGHTGDILSNPKRFDPNELPLPGDAKATAPKAIPLLVTPTASYIPELGGSNQTAQTQMVRRAATQIVNMMEVWR
jgi:Lipopolysaccharide-assembly